MVPSEANPIRVAFTPTITEHFRATGELRRIAGTYDGAGALPYFLACLLLIRALGAATSGLPDLDELFVIGMPVMFLLGVGIRVRGDLGRELSYDFGDEAIEVRQPRHRWMIPWSRGVRWAETAEFFLGSTGRAGFYVPKRALEGDQGVARLREILAARGVAA